MSLAAMWTGTSLLPPREERKGLALFAFITAIHFSTFTAALERTSIAHSLALTYTAPVFAALIAYFFIKEELFLRQWFGILLVVLSVGWMCFGYSTTNTAFGGRPLGSALGLVAGDLSCNWPQCWAARSLSFATLFGSISALVSTCFHLPGPSPRLMENRLSWLS